MYLKLANKGDLEIDVWRDNDGLSHQGRQPIAQGLVRSTEISARRQILCNEKVNNTIISGRQSLLFYFAGPV
jgi:hypothetical protein